MTLTPLVHFELRAIDLPAAMCDYTFGIPLPSAVGDPCAIHLR